MGKRHLVVISVDALVYEDIADTRELPLFAELIRGGSLIKNVRTVYPSLTHTVHASIITGQPAGVTGIVSNTVFTPGSADMPWYNDLSQIKCETIFDLAHAAGAVTAACRWPVTANAGDKIDFLIPELMDKDLENAGGDVIRGYLNIGMTECLKGIMERAISPSHTMSHVEHPEYDEIQIDCACEIIRRYKPDLLLTHPGYVDSERHRTGLFSPYVAASVKKSEEWIGRLIQAAKDAGIYADTDFVILSDHGHLPYSKIVRLNKLFADEGLISIDDVGHVTGWEAYAHSSDLSAQIYVSRPEDAELTGRVTELLRRWRDEESAGIGEIMTACEAERAYGLKGDFSFVIEGAEGYHFSDEWQGEAIYEEPPAAPGLGHSAHGHRPEKGPQPVFIGFGPDFEKGKVTDGGSVLEYFAMFRRILNI
jgi:predicted AlkP superfamily pyrophosphatase or phosphodiesterase